MDGIELTGKFICLSAQYTLFTMRFAIVELHRPVYFRRNLKMITDDYVLGSFRLFVHKKRNEEIGPYKV